MKSARESAQVFIDQEKEWLYGRLSYATLDEELYILDRLHYLELL